MATSTEPLSLSTSSRLERLANGLVNCPSLSPLPADGASAPYRSYWRHVHLLPELQGLRGAAYDEAEALAEQRVMYDVVVTIGRRPNITVRIP